MPNLADISAQSVVAGLVRGRVGAGAEAEELLELQEAAERREGGASVCSRRGSGARISCGRGC